MKVGVCFLVVVLLVHGLDAASKCALTGVNLSSGEYASGTIPGTYGTNYIYPSSATANYFLNNGMNVYRIPFIAGRVQLFPGANLSTTELSHLDATINYITNATGKYAILDPHNYGSLFGGKVGQSACPISVFADFWAKLATHYQSNPRVIFGLMNEPNGQSASIWWQAAQAAVNAIRNVNATQLILVPGVSWTGAYSWISSGNGAYMINVTDPANNMAFEVHQYLDSDSSGTHDACVSSTIGSQRLAAFTSWAKTNKVRGFLGEFGGGRNEVCYEAITDILTYMDNNSDIWLGWTYWAGGAWWSDTYFTLLQPNSSGIARPQWPYVAAHINTTTITLPIPKKPATSTVPQVVTANSFVYNDSLIGFADYSFATHSLQNTTVVHSGRYSISFAPDNYGALWFKCPTNGCITIGNYLTLDFWFNPGVSGSASSINFNVINGSTKASPTYSLATYLESTPAANQWVKGHIPLLAYGNNVSYDGIQFSSNSASQLPTMFLDDIAFVQYTDSGLVYGAGTTYTTSSASSSDSSSSTSSSTSPTSSSSTSSPDSIVDSSSSASSLFFSAIAAYMLILHLV